MKFTISGFNPYCTYVVRIDPMAFGEMLTTNKWHTMADTELIAINHTIGHQSDTGDLKIRTLIHLDT